MEAVNRSHADPSGLRLGALAVQHQDAAVEKKKRKKAVGKSKMKKSATGRKMQSKWTGEALLLKWSWIGNRNDRDVGAQLASRAVRQFRSLRLSQSGQLAGMAPHHGVCELGKPLMSAVAVPARWAATEESNFPRTTRKKIPFALPLSTASQRFARRHDDDRSPPSQANYAPNYGRRHRFSQQPQRTNAAMADASKDAPFKSVQVEALVRLPRCVCPTITCPCVCSRPRRHSLESGLLRQGGVTK